MSKFSFTKLVNIDRDKFFAISTDYERFTEILPEYFLELKIVERDGNTTKIFETLRFLGKTVNVTTEHVIEKPDRPKSNFGILPLYYFKSDIFSSLGKIKPGKGKEFQLTDAIQNLIKEKKQVLAIPLNKNEDEIDVGTVESYKNSQEITFRKA